MPPDGASAATRRRWPRGAVWYLAAGAVLTLLAVVLRWQVAPAAGLARSVYAGTGFAGEPLLQDRTAELDLAFLDRHPELPRESFSVRWGGFWFLPRAQTVDLTAAAPGRLEILIDGRTRLQHDGTAGGPTIARDIVLSEGAHAFIVRYRHDAGPLDLRVEQASADVLPGPFTPRTLFVESVDARDYRLRVTSTWLSWLVAAFWLVPAAVLIGVRAGPPLLRSWRQTGAPRTIGAYGRRVSLVVLPSLLLPVVVLLVGPHTIFDANRGEFSTGFGEIAWPWLGVAVGVAWVWLLAAGAVCAAVSERLTRGCAALLLALGLLFWAQGNLWVGDYGVLDGRAVDWSRQAWRVPYELAAWMAIPVLAVTFSRRLVRVVPFAAGLFLAVQAAALAVASVGSGAAQTAKWEEPPPGLFQFSSERNVIHIVLDEFQSDVFQDMLEREPARLDEQFAGFTFFADHLGSFPSTSLSMPAMLTGREYRNDRPVPEFVRQAFSEGSIFTSLSDAGYVIDATSIVPAPWFEDWFVPADSPVNVDAARFVIRKPFVSRQDYREFTARELLELSVSRHVPHLMKVALAAHPAWFDRILALNSAASEASERRHEAANSVAFFEQFIETMSLGRDRPAYKLLHVGVPHRPIVVDDECGFTGERAFSPSSYLGQCRCAIRLVGAFFDRLRDLGIYDSSLIVVSSDHGTDLRPGGLFGRSESLPLASGVTTPPLANIIGSSRPLMLIKPPGRTGPLRVSMAPTSHLDLADTMRALLELPEAGDTESMFDRDESAPRRRVYGMYDLSQRFPERYLDRLDVLTVDTRAVDASGWRLRRSILPPDTSLPPSGLRWGSPSARAYLGPGWAESAGSSSVEPASLEAVVFVTLPAGPLDLTARLRVPAGGGLQSVAVAVDGRAVGQWDVRDQSDDRRYAVRIPADAARPPLSTVTFRFVASGTETFQVAIDRMSFGSP